MTADSGNEVDQVDIPEPSPGIAPEQLDNLPSDTSVEETSADTKFAPDPSDIDALGDTDLQATEGDLDLDNSADLDGISPDATDCDPGEEGEIETADEIGEADKEPPDLDEVQDETGQSVSDGVDAESASNGGDLTDREIQGNRLGDDSEGASAQSTVQPSPAQDTRRDPRDQEPAPEREGVEDLDQEQKNQERPDQEKVDRSPSELSIKVRSALDDFDNTTRTTLDAVDNGIGTVLNVIDDVLAEVFDSPKRRPG